MDDAVRRGDLGECRRLYATGVAILDAHADDNYALRSAVARGHLGVCRWLHATFHLTPADARAEHKFVLGPP